MALNIKNPDTHRLAKELAALTGESMSDAVAEAVRERLARVRSQHGGRLADQLMAIGRETAPLFKEPWRSIDHGDLLYGDDGLPK
jgi:antitoxin VapB